MQLVSDDTRFSPLIDELDFEMIDIDTIITTYNVWMQHIFLMKTNFVAVVLVYWS